MANKSPDEKTERRYLSLPASLWVEIDSLSEKEDRSWYDMVRVLIKAGLAHREQMTGLSARIAAARTRVGKKSFRESDHESSKPGRSTLGGGGV